MPRGAPSRHLDHVHVQSVGHRWSDHDVADIHVIWLGDRVADRSWKKLFGKASNGGGSKSSHRPWRTCFAPISRPLTWIVRHDSVSVDVF